MKFSNIFADLADPDNITVPFKRYRDMTISELAVKDPGYLRWALKKTDWGSNYQDAIEKALETSRMDKAQRAPEPDLTEHQREKANFLLDAIEGGMTIVRLQGGAGYGKSYVTRKLARDLILNGYEVNACAVSYVATQVLARQLEPLGVSCNTVASSFKFNKVHEGAAERYEHDEEKTPEAMRELVKRNRVLIIDECSMIHDRDADLLFDVHESLGDDRGVIILVGDVRQLPPVKQSTISRCCAPMHESQVAELMVPMRYDADSPLFLVEQLMRDAIHPLNDLSSLPQSPSLSFVTGLIALIEVYVSQYRADPAALHRMLLFRRDQVTAANHLIRASLFGSDPDPVEEDEQLMILATSDFEKQRYYSGEIFQVINKNRSTYHAWIGNHNYVIPCWEVEWMDDDGNVRQSAVRLCFGVSESRLDMQKLGSAELQEALQAARDEAKAWEEKMESGDPGAARITRKMAWDPYWRLKNAFVRVCYLYATSVHRAQGQTCDYAYCVPGDLLNVSGRMGRSLSYVATTRARKNLTLVL